MNKMERIYVTCFAFITGYNLVFKSNLCVGQYLAGSYVVNTTNNLCSAVLKVTHIIIIIMYSSSRHFYPQLHTVQEEYESACADRSQVL